MTNQLCAKQPKPAGKYPHASIIERKEEGTGRWGRYGKINGRYSMNKGGGTLLIISLKLGHD